MNRFHSFDSLYHDVLWELMNDKETLSSAPRGKRVNEIICYRAELTDPRSRLISYKARNANYGFAVGEFLWYWAGRNDLETMLYYNKRMKEFSNDGKTVNSAYGYRLRQEWLVGSYLESTRSYDRLSQWETVKRTLAEDPDSRRAVMTINRPSDQVDAVVEGSKDVPCTLSLQFFVREKKLHLHVNMRSNDAIWGLTYDLFSFTLMQECMMLDLRESYPNLFGDLTLGSYYHTAGSMHVYEPMFKMSESILSESIEWKNSFVYKPNQSTNLPGYIKMGSIDSLEQVDTLSLIERDLREGKISSIDSDVFGFTGGCRWMADQLNLHREKRNAAGI